MNDRRGVSEIDRRLANLIRVGQVVEVDPARAVLRVALGGEAVSDWLPWVTARAGATRSFAAPSVGEQVVVLSPSGNTGQGVVLPSLFGAGGTAPASEAGVERVEFSDGTVVELRGGVVRLSCASVVEITAPTVRILGDVEVTGDVRAGNVSLREHLHGGVESGNDRTTAPVGG